MTTYKDLSPYSYWDSAEGPDEGVADLNVGWHGDTPDFETGPVDPAFLTALRALPRVNQTRGFHACGLCDPSDLDHDDGTNWGSAELHVKAPDGTVYGAPTLIVHYVEVHDYRPPQVFIDAVLQG